jgi:hypothetical protein
MQAFRALVKEPVRMFGLIVDIPQKDRARMPEAKGDAMTAAATRDRDRSLSARSPD